jgi:large subunit ribosomal protein L15
MEQNKLKPAPGAKHNRKRVGRGLGSGHGNYSGRGCKGDQSRSGGSVRIGYEGGQNPIMQRLPRKRGFTNIFKKEFSIVNVGSLNIFEANSEISPDDMLKAGLIKSLSKPVKILGNGNVDKPLVVKVNKSSESAQKKIAEAGGRIESI